VVVKYAAISAGAKRKAAEQSFAAAQYNLGQAYNSGVGIAKDNAEAAHWWQKASEQGIAKAQYNLGLAYHSGAGVQKNDCRPQHSVFWLF
jgi:uncharacterized protein